MSTIVETRVLIIGTGFSGIGMGIKLQKAGINDFVILEKAHEFGGTWRDNVYPGIACDVPAHLYSFSFEPNPNWSRMWAPGAEIQKYLVSVADKHRLREHTVFGSKVVQVVWNEAEFRWHVSTEDDREYVAQFVVSGVGALHVPSVPDIPGRQSFQGAQFHTAEWDSSVSLEGKRVAVVGTGASAIQVVPGIIDKVDKLTLFQRTPAWVVTRPDWKIPRLAQLGFKWIPGTRMATRLGIHLWQESIGEGMTKHLQLLKVIEFLGKRDINRKISDPELRRKLTPSYSAGCKRIGFAVGFYEALNSPKADVTTDSIVSVTENGIITKDNAGKETLHEVDIIVWATGFHVADSYRYMGTIVGGGGNNLVDMWNKTGMDAHRGITVADMPNLFFLLGPNTGLGHNSVVIMIEAQIDYVVQAIRAVDKRKAAALSPTKNAQAAYNDWVQHELDHTVQNTGGCTSWYFDEHGKNRVLWPGHTGAYRRAVRKLDSREYIFFGRGKKVATTK
ncbi:MAG: NAD(P)/FAD-dependent oxidoreductase [Candidatus Nomurabacteria bacterium]|nr:MAG: NAD(P)/FAD-dependent oxidoreductase [Candidatus Nomurabacteria bacterium]